VTRYSSKLRQLAALARQSGNALGPEEQGLKPTHIIEDEHSVWRDDDLPTVVPLGRNQRAVLHKLSLEELDTALEQAVRRCERNVDSPDIER
jgi:hypothetical protein